MILEYGGKNCWSFKEWLTINFQLNKNVPEEYGFNGIRVAPFLCFEGGNAAGKTVALRVLTFIMDFCKNSFLREPESQIPFDSFYNNDGITEFYLKFSPNNDISNVFLYELKLDKNRIHSERLFLVNKKKQRIFSRRFNKIIFNDCFGNVDNIIFRGNASFFSTLFQYGIKNTKVFYDFFASFQSNVMNYGNHEVETGDEVAKFYYDNRKYLTMVIDELKRFDTGIDSVEVLKAKKKNDLDAFFSVFSHVVEGETQVLPWYYESLGTIRLYNLFADIVTTIDSGGLLVVDELDTHLHSKIVPELLAFFSNSEININHAQLVFTSHAYDLLDRSKKYRTYLFMKEQNESFCYRIDELKGSVLIRNDKSLSSLYYSGALGGLPDVSSKQ